MIGERDAVTIERDQNMVERDVTVCRVESAVKESYEFISNIRDANF